MLSKSTVHDGHPTVRAPISVWESAHSLRETFFYHARTLWLFSCTDIAVIIVTGTLFGALNASIASKISDSMGPSLSPQQILARTPAMVLWLWTHLLLNNIHNQHNPASIAEDRVNKPWRPLPAGRLTPAQVHRLMYALYGVNLAVTTAVGGGRGPEALLMALTLWYNELGGADNAFLKNLLNGFGLACFFAGPLEVATGHAVLFAGAGDGRVARWLLVLVLAIVTTSHVQDFRDIEGDRLVHARTLPILLGDMQARLVVAVAVPAWTAIACWFWGVTLTSSWEGSVAAWVAGGAMLGNLFCDRTQKGDGFTWRLYPLWLLGLFLIPVSL